MEIITMFVHPYSWEWREAQSTAGNMGPDPCPTESGTPMTAVQICESFSLLFTLVPIPNPTMRGSSERKR